MPFKKKVPKSNDVTYPVDVTQETQVSVPVTDEIVPKGPATPEKHYKTETQSRDEIIAQDLADPDFSGIYGWNMAEMEFLDVNQTKAPQPPKCVQQFCQSRDLVWRWLSYPAAKAYGMRGYVALSMTPELRKKIKAGDCPATVDIDVTNKLTWREDAFLGVQPKKLYLARMKSKHQRTIDQTKLAKAQGAALQDVAGRAGGKIVEYTVEETSRQGL
jgi:hypothetical protein